MMMSAPSARWISIARSGERKCLVPSRWLRNSTPSSAIFTRPSLPPFPSSSPRDASPRLKTWKPPESVRSAPPHAMNRCSPPRRRTRSWPGRRYRWYVFARRMRAPSSSRSRGESVFTVAAVPTGMKTGVSTVACGVVSRPRRAAPSCPRSAKEITRVVSRAAPPVSSSRGPAARPGGLGGDALPGAGGAALGDDPQPDGALQRTAHAVPADDGTGAAPEEALAQLDRDHLAHHRQGPLPCDGASALGHVQGDRLALGPVAQDEERLRDREPRRALAEAHLLASGREAEEVGGREAHAIERELDARRQRRPTHAPHERDAAEDRGAHGLP